MQTQTIIDALYKFARQRPGLEFGNYGDVSAYRSEMRSITKDLHDARILLRRLELSSITPETLQKAFSAFSGRLSLTPTDKGLKLDYCTGQYWPTEYRRAVCAVAAAALWDHYRDSFSSSAKHGESPGDAIRRCFRREFGRSIAKRWFS
jgi:hypothetical protein